MNNSMVGGVAWIVIAVIGLCFALPDVLGFLSGAQPVRGKAVAVQSGGRYNTNSVTVEVDEPSPFAGTHYPQLVLFGPPAGSEVQLLAKPREGRDSAEVRLAAWWELWHMPLVWLAVLAVGVFSLPRKPRRAAPEDPPA